MTLDLQALKLKLIVMHNAVIDVMIDEERKRPDAISLIVLIRVGPRKAVLRTDTSLELANDLDALATILANETGFYIRNPKAISSDA